MYLVRYNRYKKEGTMERLLEMKLARRVRTNLRGRLKELVDENVCSYKHRYWMKGRNERRKLGAKFRLHVVILFDGYILPRCFLIRWATRDTLISYTFHSKMRPANFGSGISMFNSRTSNDAAGNRSSWSASSAFIMCSKLFMR